MRNWESELAELRRRIDTRLREAALLAGRRQHDTAGRVDEAGLAVLDAPLESGAVPADAPPQYRDVADRLGAGELDWQTMLAGDTADEGDRAMAIWMDRRLQQVEEVGALVRDGVPIDAAYAEVTTRARR
jgi:hypothetical protein